MSKPQILARGWKQVEPPDAGWQFTGSTGPGQHIPIGALIADLAAKFGATTLPGTLAGLTIQKLSAKVDIDGQQPEDVAEGWLKDKHFTG